jgi:hypothetical protein
MYTEDELAAGAGEDAGSEAAWSWLWSLRRRVPLFDDLAGELDVEDEDEVDRLRDIAVEGFYAGVAKELRGWLARMGDENVVRGPAA